MSSNVSSFGISAVSRVFNDSSSDVRGKVVSIYTFLIIFNLVTWIIALIAFAGVPSLLGLAVIAYTLGLRHSVDADHISAIDNVTRKLMQEKKKPVAVGFFFSLGHSTVVVLLSVLVAIVAAIVETSLPQWQDLGGL